MSTELQTAVQTFNALVANLYNHKNVKYFTNIINDAIASLKEEMLEEVERIKTKTFKIKCGNLYSEYIMYNDGSIQTCICVTFPYNASDDVGSTTMSVNEEIFHMLNSIDSLDDLAEEEQIKLQNALLMLVPEDKL